ncbi:MAG: polysaccharide pyruvyl transferase family protein [Candidatus Bipolaricaulaceae bacterium]
MCPRRAVRLYGYFARGNLGDEALRLTWTQALAPVRCAPIAPPHLPRGRGPTLFVGGLFQDRTSRRSLAFYALAVAAAAAQGPVGLAAVGADMTHPLSRRLVRWALARADYISARDQPSLYALSRLAADVRPGRDPVLAWPPPRRGGGGPVLVNLAPSLPRSARQAARGAALTAARRLGAPLRGLALAGEDLPALRGLSPLRPPTPALALAAVASSPLLVGCRLHALELALVAGTPFLAVPWTAKVAGLVALVERELPCPVPCVGEPGWERVLSPRWRQGLARARDRLHEEAEESIRDVRDWINAVA